MEIGVQSVSQEMTDEAVSQEMTDEVVTVVDLRKMIEDRIINRKMTRHLGEVEIKLAILNFLIFIIKVILSDLSFLS